ncbi:MAG: DUF3179 domain-containing (seleno)protein [Fuerstiella sp.]|nr:DUF3179 domain-containing (seleno)protein [Fuerstiella sp.]
MRKSSASGVLLFMATIAGCGSESANNSRHAEEEQILNAAMQNTPFISEKIQLPESVNADAAELRTDEPIIGVVADGIARAYSIKAMSGMSSHVINDVIGTMPVSVTYCDRTDCARAFTGDTPGQPLSLAVGGFSDSEMLVRFGGEMYRQSSPDIPLTEYECELTTWKKWLERHPGTKVMTTIHSDSKPDSLTVPN